MGKKARNFTEFVEGSRNIYSRKSFIVNYLWIIFISEAYLIVPLPGGGNATGSTVFAESTRVGEGDVRARRDIPSATQVRALSPSNPARRLPERETRLILQDALSRLTRPEKPQACSIKGNLSGGWMAMKETRRCVETIGAGVRKSEHVAGRERRERTRLREHVRRQAEAAEHVRRGQRRGPAIEQDWGDG